MSTEVNFTDSDGDDTVEETLQRLQRECQAIYGDNSAKSKASFTPSYSYGCARTSGVAVSWRPGIKKEKQEGLCKTPSQKASDQGSVDPKTSTIKPELPHKIKIKPTPGITGLRRTVKPSSVYFRKARKGESGQVKRETRKPESVRCEDCGAVFTFKANLNRHMESHSALDKDYKCDECGKMFAVKRNLARHLKLHEPIDLQNLRPFTCDICNKSFMRSKTLYQHKKLHENKRPYACQFCTKTFKNLFTLQSHENIHLNCKPYGCQYCGKAFIRSSYRTIHERIHTNERPFKCNICEKAFIRGDHLKGHLKVHQKVHRKKCK